ncbi:MAG: hypothetical protein OXI27_06305 [Thaumarchaeota archaeon]|nr:hypothetical protein [Nitrososphaerota archaeon]
MTFLAEIRACDYGIGSVGDIKFEMSGYSSSNSICGSDARASLDPNDAGRDFVRSTVYTNAQKNVVAYYHIPAIQMITIEPGQTSGNAVWATRDDGTAGKESFTVMVAPLSVGGPAHKAHWLHPDTPEDGTFLSQKHWKASIDGIPVVTVGAGGSTNVVEGTELRVQFTAVPAANPEIQLTFYISETGDVIHSSIEGIETSPIRGGLTYRITTQGDSTDEVDSTVTVSLRAGDGYTVGSPSSVTFTVRDNDPGPLGSGSPPPPTTVSIGIAGGGAEGDPVSFGISAAPAPLQPLPVNVTLSGTGNILNASDIGWRMIEIPAIGSYTLEVPTLGDNVADVNNVTLTINPGAGYTPGQFASWTVDVQDAGAGQEPVQPPVYDKLARAQDLTAVAIDPALIANVTAMANQTQHGDAHVDRWNRVLAAFGEISHDSPTTAAEARANSEKYSSPLWPLIADVLALLEAAAEQDGPQTPPDVPTEPDAPPAVDPELVSKVRAQAAQVQHGDAHVDRWNRVLAAFGEIDHPNPTTAAEARANSEKYSSPLWPQIADVLANLEAGG